MIAGARPSPVRRHSGSYSGLQVRSPTAFRSPLAIPRCASRTDGQGQNSEDLAHLVGRKRVKEERNALVCRSSDLERPFVTHNAELLPVIGTELEYALEALITSN